MNDRVSAFCTGVGAAGATMGLAFACGGLVMLAAMAALLMVWSVVLLPMGILDWWGDSHGWTVHPHARPDDRP